MGNPPKSPCECLELLWWVLAITAQHPHTHTCTVLLAHPDAILNHNPLAQPWICPLLPKLPAPCTHITPENTGKTPALAKMFNLSLMHVFIYKY